MVVVGVGLEALVLMQLAYLAVKCVDLVALD
jgi:hypothetical protein